MINAVQPNEPVEQGLQFDVERRQKRSRSEFVVEIVPKKSSLPKDFSVSLSSVQIETNEDGGNSIEIKGIPNVDCSIAQTAVCRFAVFASLLESPDLGFLITSPVYANVNGQQVSMPAVDMFYFKLSDIPPLKLSFWQVLQLRVEEILDRLVE